VTDLTTQIDDNKAAISTLESEINTLATEIASARTDLINAKSLLTDDEAYLKDLTEQCEARAHDWDQRSQMRAGELDALSKATAILKNDVEGADENVNYRALLIQKNEAPVKKHESPAFIQESAVATKAHRRNALRGLSTQLRTQQAVALLRATGEKIGSLALTSLALKVAGDPFSKVKTLIQNLVERLLQEATEEATKKGFCDTELSKAEQDRDFRWSESKKLSVEIAELEVKKDQLDLEMQELATALTNLDNDFQSATTLRAQEKEDNLAVLKEAKGGLAAVEKALVLLKSFYKEASKAKVLLQASPVDEDTTGPGFDSAYKGNQAKSSGIIGLLEVIRSDFERTISTTKESEKQAAADFVNFDRQSKVSTGGKDTKKSLDGEDFETTSSTLAAKYKDLKTAFDLLDSALRTIEDLKPMCIDSSMTYAERVEKREDEIEALKQALCLLDTDGVELDCQDGAAGPS